MNRRAYLHGVVACVAGTAGCLRGRGSSLVDAPGEELSLDASDGSDGWPQLACNAGNTKYAPRASAPTDDPTVAWEKFGDRPISRPVIGDSVFVTERQETSSAFRLSGDDGATQWVDESEAATRLNPALVDDQLVVLRRASPPIQALRTSDGTETWTQSPDESVTRRTPTFQNGPTVYGETVYVVTESGVLALEAATGEQNWDATIEDDPDAEWSPPAVDDDSVYVADRERRGQAITIHALDRNSGDPEWSASVEFDRDRMTVRGYPVLGRDRVFAVASEITSFDLGSSSPPPLDHWLLAFDAATGDLDWEWELPGETEGPPAVADDVLFLCLEGHEDDIGSLVALDANDGSPVWARETTASKVRSPTVTTDSVYYVRDETVEAVDVRGGSVQWELGLDERVATLAVAGDTVYARTGPSLGKKANEIVAIKSE